MGVTDTIQATAGNVAGAGAAILLSAKESAEGLLKAGWTAPSLKIPSELIDKKVKGKYVEIPPAILMMGVGALLVYGYLRKKEVRPFDWLFEAMDKVKIPGALGGAGGGDNVVDVGATIPTETTAADGTVIPTIYKVIVMKGGATPYSVWGPNEDMTSVIQQAQADYISGTSARLWYSVDRGTTWKLVGNGVLW